MKKTLALFIMIAGLSVLNAENLIKNTEDSWGDVPVDKENGVLWFELAPDIHLLKNTSLIPVDPKSYYSLSCKVKTDEGSSNHNFYLGFQMFDKNKQQIKKWHVVYDKKTKSALAEKCEKGDMIIKIKDASKWKSLKPKKQWIGFYNDKVPELNRDTYRIEKIVKKNLYWEITLKTACRKAYAKDTAVMEYKHGPDVRWILACESKSLKEKPMEVSKKFNTKRFWKGTKYLKPIVYSNNNRDCAILFSGVKLEKVQEQYVK